MNSLTGLLEKAIPSIGHACAMHQPDCPGLVWEDTRLLGEISRINNKERFIAASSKLYERLRRLVKPEIDLPCIKEEADLLVKDLDWAIGIHDSNNSDKSLRIGRYIELSKKAEYGSSAIAEYTPDK